MSLSLKIDEFSLKVFGNNKTFFECGGAHPEIQSHTNLLEKNGWGGLVVEPWSGYNELYKNSRKNTILENYALVSRDYVGETIEATFSADFGGSVINGAHGNTWNPSTYPVSTVTKLLLKHNITEVHQATVDVEGYELEVLKGIDFSKIKIHMIIPEHHWGEKFDFLKDFGFEELIVIPNSMQNQHLFFNTKSEFYEDAKMNLELLKNLYI